VIRDIIMADLYVPRSYDEVAALVSPEVAAKLDPEKSYGLWEWGAIKNTRTQVSEQTPEGRIYRTRQKRTLRPKEERIYVPIPNSGVPREWIESAREAIKNNRRASNAGRRFWELSGGILRCGECGWTMYAHTAPPGPNGRHYYYVCKAKYRKGPEFCTATRTRKATELEELVWAEVRAYLQDPERLRSDLNRMIELEREGTHGDPECEAKVWAGKLAEANTKRARFQHAYAEGIIELEELRERLLELEEETSAAERALAELRSRVARVRELEADRDALLEHYVATAPEALDSLTPEERHHFYKMLRLKVRLFADDSMEITGVFPEPIRSEPAVCTVDGSSTRSPGRSPIPFPTPSTRPLPTPTRP
jgi:site-specific DNA recombinase